MKFSKCPDCGALKQHKLDPVDEIDWLGIFGSKPPKLQCEKCRARLRAKVEEDRKREQGQE
jgi:hypothetical protein